MKLSLELEGATCTIDSVSVIADDVLDDCIHAMLGSGFAEDSVYDAIVARAQEIEMDRGRKELQG